MTDDLLSAKYVEALRTLLGRAIHVIWTPSLDVAGTHLAARKLSMMLEKNSWVNFSCRWSETPHFMNDSWLIDVSESSEPAGLEQDTSRAYIAPSTIRMYNAQPIKGILIQEYLDESEGSEQEGVHYDRAILFQTAGDREFCISCTLNGPGIATGLNFSEDPAVIQMLLDGSTVRLTLDQS